MAETIIMPQGGQDITEGRVLRWHKAEGDPVKKDEVICEVETEKAVFEVKSPLDGVLLKIVVPAGKIAHVFSAIGYVGAAGESVELDDEEDSVEEKKVANPRQKDSGIDIAALRKKVAAKSKDKKGKVKALGIDDGDLHLVGTVPGQQGGQQAKEEGGFAPAARSADQDAIQVKQGPPEGSVAAHAEGDEVAVLPASAGCRDNTLRQGRVPPVPSRAEGSRVEGLVLAASGPTE